MKYEISSMLNCKTMIYYKLHIKIYGISGSNVNMYIYTHMYVLIYYVLCVLEIYIYILYKIEYMLGIVYICIYII